MKVKNDHRRKFSNLSNWKEEAAVQKWIKVKQVMSCPSFGHEKDYQVEHYYFRHKTVKTNDKIRRFGVVITPLSRKNVFNHPYFPANLLCRVTKGWLCTAHGLVSRLFRSCSLPPWILNAGRQLVIFKCPTQLKPQICYLFLTREWNLVKWLMTSLP